MRVALILLLTSCATVRPGVMLSQLPAGVPWCGKGPQAVALSTAEPEPASELIAGSAVSACTLMLKEPCIHSGGEWRGTVEFELSSDEHGRLSEVCVVGGNFGDVTEYVACIVHEIRRYALVAPNLKRVSWMLTYVCD